MHNWNKQIAECFGRRAQAGCALLALAVLAGCAAFGNPAPEKAEPSGLAPNQSSVARLEPGRDGFVIKEVAQMDEASRRDFESAVAKLNTQEYSQAVDLLERVIAHAPGVTAPYIDIAIAYQQLGKPEQAEASLQSALRLFPDHPVACNEYGLLYRKSGRFEEARAIYEKAIARFPDYYPVHRNLGILCDLYLNDLSCALAHYEIYSECKPEDKQVKLWIADINNRLGSK